MKIKTTFLALFSIVIFFMLIIFGLLLLLLENQQKQQESHVNRYYSFRFGDELRQSSDHLTNYSRSYVVTGDSVWEQKFLAVTKSRSNMFSDIGKQRSFLDSMYNMGFEKDELALLDSALHQSNILVTHEKKAIKKAKELFSDETNQFTINNESEIQLAINSLYNVEYLSYKENIMELILLYEKLIDQRTLETVNKYARKGAFLLYLIIALIFVVIAMSVLAYLLISKRLNRKQEITNQLNDRVKEQSCLYGISRLTESTKHSIEHVLEGVASIVPSGWKYPEITCARVTFQKLSFTTANFKETPWKQEVNILNGNKKYGTIEVYYLEEKPNEDIGPFLKEEQTLIETIGNLIVGYYERKEFENNLNKMNNDLRAEITEKNLAKQQLEKSELQFKILVNNLNTSL